MDSFCRSEFFAQKLFEFEKPIFPRFFTSRPAKRSCKRYTPVLYARYMLTLEMSTVAIPHGATDSVFERSEAWLQQDRYECLVELSDVFSGTEFRSVMDFVFVTIFPTELESCLAFYDDVGPAVCDKYSAQMIEKMDRMILRTLKCAAAIKKENEKLEWADLLAALNQ